MCTGGAVEPSWTNPDKQLETQTAQLMRTVAVVNMSKQRGTAPPEPSLQKQTEDANTESHSTGRGWNEVYFLLKVKDMQTETKANRRMKGYINMQFSGKKSWSQARQNTQATWPRTVSRYCQRLWQSSSNSSTQTISLFSEKQTLHLNMCVIYTKSGL